MKQSCTQCGATRNNSHKGFLAALGTVGCAALLLVLNTTPCIGQGVNAPTIQNLSIIQGTNTRTMKMWIPTQEGVNYTAEFKSLLGASSWSQITNFPGSGSSDPIADNVTSVSRRFYRVAVDPRPWIRSQPISRNPYAGETVQLDV